MASSSRLFAALCHNVLSARAADRMQETLEMPRKPGQVITLQETRSRTSDEMPCKYNIYYGMHNYHFEPERMTARSFHFVNFLVEQGLARIAKKHFGSDERPIKEEKEERSGITSMRCKCRLHTIIRLRHMLMIRMQNAEHASVRARGTNADVIEHVASSSRAKHIMIQRARQGLDLNTGRPRAEKRHRDRRAHNQR